jgi:pimeloyl-ACP methyl ester carboxylesterase
MSGSTLRFVSALDGTRLAWRTHTGGGSEEDLRGKRAIILTNGLSTTDNFWTPIVHALAGDNRVVHWSYRGHGESESARSGDYAIKTHAKDLERVTEAVRAQGTSALPAVHVAFSMGVTVLLELVRARPDLVGAMVLVAGGADHPHSSSPFLRVPGARSAIRGVLRIALPIVSRASPITRRIAAAPALYPMARAVGAIGKGAPREELEQFFRAVGAMDLEAFLESARSLMDAHASDVLERVKVPVLIVAPERDLLASRADLAALREGLPGAEWFTVPGTTHAMLLEAGGEVGARIAAFLRELEGG